MSNSRQFTPGATAFGPGIGGNPARAVYQRSSRKITHAIAANPSFVNGDPTTPYLTPDQIMLRASDIGDHSPHAVGNANDPAVRRIRWLNNSFPDLLFPDRIWGEAIKASRLWEEWGPTGLVRDPVFTRLLNNGVWDSREGGRSMAEIESMRYTAALASRLMLKGLEQETKHDKLEAEWNEFQKLWNAFIERVDADSIALDERTKRHRQLLNDNLRWQRKAEEMAGRHEQRIDDLEKNLEEKEIYINNMECALATLMSRMDAMEDKVCRCNDAQVEEIVEEEDDPTSELSYESQYFTPVAIAGLIEDVPHRLVPIGDLEVTPGGFEEEVRDGDVEENSVASQVAEQVLQEEEESSDGTDVEQFMHPSQRAIASPSIHSLPAPSYVSWATQTVKRDYADAQVEAVNVQCMPRGEFRQLVSQTVRESQLTQVLVAMRGMQSSLEGVVSASELMLAAGLSQVQTMQAAFVPTVVEGNATPESVEGGHLTEEGDGEEGTDREETSL